MDSSGDLLIFTVSGEWEFESARELIDVVGAECRKQGRDRVLLDNLAVEIDGTVLAFERFLLGQRIAESLRGIRVAVIFPAEHINKFTESVAVAAGAELLVTGDRESALEWLSLRE